LKSFSFILSVLAVMGLVFWAYNENYKTKAAVDEVDYLQREIGSLLETRAVLRAEWAYLNRPDRLRELASINFETLKLMPLQPEQFAQVDQIGYPPKPEPVLDLGLELENIIDVIGILPEGETEPSAEDEDLFEPLPKANP